MTLDNKLGLTDSLELAKMEEKISKTRAKKLFEEQLLDDKAAGTYATLAFIHGFLFEEIYDFLVDFTAIIAYAYPERTHMINLRDHLNTIRSRYKKRKPAKKVKEEVAESN